LPSKEQELLLRATFLGGDDAIRAWEEWKYVVDLDDHLDPGSFRLLPQLYHNLKNNGVRDSLMMKFKGVSRQTWLSNQLLFNNILKSLRFLYDAGVDVLIINGAALALFYYRDYCLQPKAQFDILVRPHQVTQAIKQLQSLGWIPVPDLPKRAVERHITTSPSHLFRDQDGFMIRLYWRSLEEGFQTNTDDDFWKDAVTAELNGTKIYTLNTADQLFQLSVHGSLSGLAPLFLRATDAMMVLKAVRFEINWNRVLQQAKKAHLLLPLMGTLQYLHEKLDVPLPTSVLRSIRDAPGYKREKFECRLRNSQIWLISRSSEFWFNYSRLKGNMNWWAKLAHFPTFLQETWKLRHVLHVPLYAVSKALRGSGYGLGWIRD